MQQRRTRPDAPTPISRAHNDLRGPSRWRSLLRAALLCLALSPAAAGAQWSARTGDGGTYLYGRASDPSGTFSLSCTAPSPQGIPAIETGSHESHTTGPYGLTLELSDSLFDWSATTILSNVVVQLDQTGYRLPPVYLDELLGTGVALPMADPMIQALFGATRLLLDPGQGKAYDYDLTGLAPALDQAMIHCINRWLALGHPIPAALTRYRIEGQPSPPAAAALTATPAPAQAFAVPPTAPPAAEAHIRGLCESDYDVNIDGVQSADFDGDGAGDFILNWSDITCRGPLGARPFCGAANCQIDIFMSSLGYAAAPSFLGISTQVVTLPDGRAGFMLGGTSFVCADGYCDRPWVWTGAEFTQ